MELPATEVSSTTITNGSPPRGRRGWWQFSLLSLLLLFVIACLIAGYVGQSRRMEEARRELARRDETIKRLRQELGIDEDAESALTIDDPSKLHVAALPAWEEHVWRWKVYLPPEKKWKIGIEVLEKATPEQPLEIVNGSFSNVHGAGELIMEARMSRDLEGIPRLTARLGRGTISGGSKSFEPQFKSKRYRVELAGRPKPVVVSPGQRIEVLRRIVLFEPQKVSGRTEGSLYEKGALVIYLEEDLPPAAAKKLRESFPK